MNWNNITVKQFQEIAALKKAEGLDTIDKVIQILHGIDEDTLANVSVAKYNELSKSLAFLDTEIPKDMQKYWKHYKFIPNILERPQGAARFIDNKYFAQDVTGNLHLILATLVRPTKKRLLLGRKELPYDVGAHGVYASDMLQMPITVAMSWIGFFLTAWEQSKKNTLQSLRSKWMIQTMWKYRITKKEAATYWDQLPTTL